MNEYIEKYKEGYSIAEITLTYHLSHDEEEKVMDALTVEDIKAHRRNQDKRIVKLYKDGLTINAISKTTGVSLSFVKKIIGNKA